MPKGKIPGATVSRLPIYARALHSLLARGVNTASSDILAHESQVNAAQIRKDLSHIGGEGTRGLGYDVSTLLGRINKELGLDRSWRVALVGYGQLGAALVGYEGFAERGFQIVAIYDADSSKVGSSVAGVSVEDSADIPSTVGDHNVDIVVLAVPASSAQNAADAVVSGGVKAILNFAPAVLDVPQEVSVRSVDLSVELQVLSFYQFNSNDE